MHVISRLTAVAFAALLAFGTLSTPAFAAGFALSANGLADDGMLPKDGGYDKMSSDGVHPCGGTNRAPGFSWL